MHNVLSQIATPPNTRKNQFAFLNFRTLHASHYVEDQQPISDKNCKQAELFLDSRQNGWGDLTCRLIHTAGDQCFQRPPNQQVPIELPATSAYEEPLLLRKTVSDSLIAAGLKN